MITPELNRIVGQYLAGEIGATELVEWYAPRLPELDPASDDAGLVAAIELALAERDQGLRDEGEVRAYIREALTPMIAAQTPARPITYSSTGASAFEFVIEGSTTNKVLELA